MKDTWSHATNNILQLIIMPLITMQLSFTTHINILLVQLLYTVSFWNAT